MPDGNNVFWAYKNEEENLTEVRQTSRLAEQSSIQQQIVPINSLSLSFAMRLSNPIHFATTGLRQEFQARRFLEIVVVEQTIRQGAESLVD